MCSISTRFLMNSTTGGPRLRLIGRMCRSSPACTCGSGLKYLEPDFTDLFLNGLRGLAQDGARDTCDRGGELARNAAVGGLALATGLRAQGFSYLLIYEIPALPPSR
jgi:hypothetical protein